MPARVVVPRNSGQEGGKGGSCLSIDHGRKCEDGRGHIGSRVDIDHIDHT